MKDESNANKIKSRTLPEKEVTQMRLRINNRLINDNKGLNPKIRSLISEDKEYLFESWELCMDWIRRADSITKIAKELHNHICLLLEEHFKNDGTIDSSASTTAIQEISVSQCIVMCNFVLTPKDGRSEPRGISVPSIVFNNAVRNWRRSEGKKDTQKKFTLYKANPAPLQIDNGDVPWKYDLLARWQQQISQTVGWEHIVYHADVAVPAVTKIPDNRNPIGVSKEPCEACSSYGVHGRQNRITGLKSKVIIGQMTIPKEVQY